ncbi:hypothetical protein CVT26_014803 [Gymnopilus dilepis]|uniref:Ricin B lectin domain-containing protein n=1 Tax=Gymnopilus dilepis TaxID=231916 RepID=A0A409W414_9AGAR|nr:hypothetical protein CVT26_014803 [Gymnopilus dilepis]
MHQDWNSSQIASGAGGAGGRGGDIGSHNSTSNSNNVNNTTINFYGPQFIVNSEGRALDLAASDKVISYPFHGGSNQRWTLADDGSGRFALKSEYNDSFVGVTDTKDGPTLIPTRNPFYWTVSAKDGSYKLVAPDIGVALGLGDSASLLPPTDKRTDVFVLEDTPENREAILKGQIKPIASPTEVLNHASKTNSVINLNITINDFSGSAAGNLVAAFNQIKDFLTSDGAKNLVVFLGQPQQGNSPAGSSNNNESMPNSAPNKVAADSWNRFRIDSNYTLILGNGHNGDWDHVYVATSGVGYYGRLEDAEGPFHRSRVRNLANLTHVKEIELRSVGPIFASSPAGLSFTKLS